LHQAIAYQIVAVVFVVPVGVADLVLALAVGAALEERLSASMRCATNHAG
jgi:hypothetical protein